MVAVQHALIDLPMTEDVARYVGMLEAKILKLTISELKKNCLLELLTDTRWDDEYFTAEDEEIRRIATKTLTKRLGIKPQEAKKLVDQRYRKYQKPEQLSKAIEESSNPPETSARLGVVHLADEASDTPLPRVEPKITQAVPVNRPQPFDARSALQGYKQRRFGTPEGTDGTARLDLTKE